MLTRNLLSKRPFEFKQHTSTVEVRFLGLTSIPAKVVGTSTEVDTLTWPNHLLLGAQLEAR